MNIQKEEMCRARNGEGLWDFHALSRPAALPASLCSATWKVSEPPTLKIFIAALSHRYD